MKTVSETSLDSPTDSDRDQRRAQHPGTEAQLVVAFDCERPTEWPSRHLLAGVDRVCVTRGSRRDARRAAHQGVRGLTLALADRFASADHALLHRVGPQRWVVVDNGSRNGIRVNGAVSKRAVLLDGDVIEVGRTLLLFRCAVVPASRDVEDLDGEAATGSIGLPTFLAALADGHAKIERVAASTLPVIVRGDSGTGKELVARAVHRLSRRSGQFVALNCGAIPDSLVEATLFGHRRGAFSGAVGEQIGMLRAAHGGTLLLDEIGDLPLLPQATFLRALQESEVVPVGDTRPVKFDARVISATHRPLEEMAAARSFRPDLFARLGGLTVTLPRLVDRREDVGLLVATLFRRKGTSSMLTPAAALALLRHDWPLNVRELERTLDAAVLLAGDARIDVRHLPAPLAQADGNEPGDAEAMRRRVELVTLLDEHGGNVAAVARDLGKHRQQIHRWLQQLGLNIADFRRR